MITSLTTGKNELPPTLVVRVKYVSQFRFHRIVDGSGAIVMPAILRAERFEHPERAVRSKLLGDKIKPRTGEQAAIQVLLRATELVSHTGAIQSLNALAEHLGQALVDDGSIRGFVHQ